MRNQGPNLDCFPLSRPSHRLPHRQPQFQRSRTTTDQARSRRSVNILFRGTNRDIALTRDVSDSPQSILSVCYNSANPFYALKIPLSPSPLPTHRYQFQKHPAARSSDGFCSPDS